MALDNDGINHTCQLAIRRYLCPFFKEEATLTLEVSPCCWGSMLNDSDAYVIIPGGGE